MPVTIVVKRDRSPKRQVVGAEQRQRNAHLPDGVGERVARAHDVADGDARGRPHVEDEDARLGGAQELPALDVVVLDGLHRLAVLAAVAPGHRPQGERAGVEDGGRSDGEAGARLLPLVGEAQGRRRRVDRPARRRLEADVGRGRAGRQVAREDAHLDRPAGRGERDRGDLRRDAHRQRGHDLHLVPALSAHERPLVPPGDRRAQGRRDPVHAAAGPGDEDGRAPRARSRPRGREARCGRGPSPGASRAATGGRRGRPDHGEARPPSAARREAGRPRPRDAPTVQPGGRLELERLHLEPGPAAVEQRHRDAHLLAGRHEPVVGARLEHEALGEGERGLDVRLLLPQALGDLGARGGIGDPGVEPLRERARTASRASAERGHGPARALRDRTPPGRRSPSPAARRASAARTAGRREPRERRERRVEAVEDVALGRGDGRLRVEQAEHPFRRTGVGPELSRALAAVHRPRADCRAAATSSRAPGRRRRSARGPACPGTSP